MSLAILVPMVLAGVTLVIALIHFSGLSRPSRIASEAEALARFAYDYPDLTMTSAILTADRRAAFVNIAEGPLGLVEAFGDRFVTELLTGDIVAHAEAVGSRLTIASSDFTWRGGTYEFSDAGDAKRLADTLTANHKAMLEIA